MLKDQDSGRPCVKQRGTVPEAIETGQQASKKTRTSERLRREENHTVDGLATLNLHRSSTSQGDFEAGHSLEGVILIQHSYGLAVVSTGGTGSDSPHYART